MTAFPHSPEQPPTNRWDFGAHVTRGGAQTLRRGAVTTLQVNVGKVCNQACHHCHVDAGPTRTETMTRAVADRVLALLQASPGVEVLDITGGAPELCAEFERLVTGARGLGRRVMDRCNLTVLLEPGMEDLPRFLAKHRVEVIASLPCYTAENVDAQRGKGVFERSIEGMRRLNALGYGDPATGLSLDLVYNPGGPSLPPCQDRLGVQFAQELGDGFGVRFNRLLTLANMPIHRFSDQLRRRGQLAGYMDLLVDAFNPRTVDGLMCRSQLSVGWDGALYDCDFNQMLEIPVGGRALTVFDLESVEGLAGGAIATDTHCFGCTAGAGSSCGGALEHTGDAP